MHFVKELANYIKYVSNKFAMSVNDIITSRAKPLFFLDYFVTSHLDVDLAEKVQTNAHNWTRLHGSQKL